MINLRRYTRNFATLIGLILFTSHAGAKVQMLDRIAAVINEGVIMESQLNLKVEEVMTNISREQASLPPMNVIRSQVLERMILEEIQLQEATRMGIRVDDTSLNEALSGIARQNNMTLEQFADAVRADGFQWAQFREDLRKDMILNQLQQRRVNQRVRITEGEVERYLNSEQAKKLTEEELNLGHILIAVPDGATSQEVQAAQQKANQILKDIEAGKAFSDMALQHSNDQYALEGGKLGWRPAAQLPSLFTDQTKGALPGDVVGPFRSGAGFHIIQLIDKRGGVQKIVEQYRVRHILIKPNTIRSPEKSLKLARELRQQVVSGEDMNELARKFSDDPGSARNGGDLEWVNTGEMVASFEQTMLKTPVGEVSHVFESEFGWHFLRVEEKRTADMSDEFRSLKARQTLHQRRFNEELELWLQEMRQETYVDIRI